MIINIFSYICNQIQITTIMMKRFFIAIERVELFVINHPFISQQVLDSCDDLLWSIIPVVDSLIQWLGQYFT